MSDRVWLVEDDPTIRELVSVKLEQNGYSVRGFDGADELSEGLTGEWPDLCIVDILLSGEKSGLDICRTLRGATPSLPILILSALSEASHRIEGLKVGADDYLTKPFEMEELLLRVSGMLRRRHWYGKIPHSGSVFEWDHCQVDFVSFECKRGGKVFQLTQKECMLIKLLVEREGEVVTRAEILDHVWGYNVFPLSLIHI